MAADALNALSDRALAAHLGVSQAFVSKHRPQYGDRPTERVARNGSVHRRMPKRRGDRRTTETAPRVEIERLRVELDRVKRALVAMERDRDQARDIVRKREAALSDLEHDADKLRNQVGRYQSDLAKRRRRAEHYVAVLCRKLVWLGWDADEALLAMTDGILVCPNKTVELSDRERAMFREMWTEVESELSRHYHLEWGRTGRTAESKTRGRAEGYRGQELDEWVAMERDEWINAQMDLDAWPWDDEATPAFGAADSGT